MNQRISCEEHGDQKVTYVCKHIVDTLRDKMSRGFWWSIDEEGDYQAKCNECEEASIRFSEHEWDKFGKGIISILCFGCFRRAGQINGIEIEGRS